MKPTGRKETSSPKAIRLREWRVTLMRNRGEFLSYVEAATRDAAEIDPVKTFGLNEFHSRRLLLQERA